MNWKLIAQIVLPALIGVASGLGIGTQVATSPEKPEPVVVNCGNLKCSNCPDLIVDGLKK